VVSVTVIGTLNFYSPEMLEGTGGGMPSDIWAVGITFFMLLWGQERSPFPNYAALLQGKPDKLPSYVPDYLAELIFRMVQLNQ
jgi:serine/threonine protein kinase